LLQLSVACYALRLNRRFGTARVGWSLFTAFVLLVPVHLLQSIGLLSSSTDFKITMDLVYSLISLLLLIGMVHLESMFKERMRAELEERKVQRDLESRVKEKTADLSRANQDLRLTARKLEAEIAERERLAAQMESTYKELIAASREAGMTEIATNVLHNVGNVLNSVNVSASLVSDRVIQSRVGNVARVAALMREHAADIGDYMSRDSKGRQLPAYLSELAEHLVEEQTLLAREIGFVKKKIEHIKDIVVMQQNYARVGGVTEKVKITELIEDALQMNIDGMAHHDVKVVREYGSHIPEIVVEKHKILQILVNLVRNARYACDEAGGTDKRVTVRVSNGSDRIRVAVVDNGVGIAAANLTKIFNYGFTTRKGGHGFGLHGSSLAAKDMGGTLTAHSEGPGKGATFMLELPVEPKPAK
jgi:C4-dicarboxylate-specific signal transduction histidine kinase